MWLPALSVPLLFTISVQEVQSQYGTSGSISDALNSFAVNFLSIVANEAGPNLNLAVSPYTVWTLMSIIAEGAQGNTLRELETVLNLPSDKDQFRSSYSNLSSILLAFAVIVWVLNRVVECSALTFQPSCRDLLQNISEEGHDMMAGATFDYAVKILKVIRLHYAPKVHRSTHGVKLDISNAIFTTMEQKLNPLFRQTSRKFYGVDVTPTNFSDRTTATKMINLYIAKATRNLIQNFINPGDVSDAEIFLTSALYFKGQWTTPFNKSATHRASFYDEKLREQTKVEMMYQIGLFPYTRLEPLRSLAVELPYGSEEKMSMVVILPYKDETLSNVLNRLSKTQFTQILSRLERAKQDYMDDEVEVYLPKFAIDSDLNLNVVFDKMGVRDVFSEERAELLGIFPHYLRVSRLIQKAQIEVNEEGTVAAAASGASIAYKSPPPKFQADRPFVYFIVDKPSKSIIFAGRVSNPFALNK